MCLTAYTARLAEILDRSCDLLLVGDSMGMVLYGMESTRGVSLEMLINHGKAVAGAARQACVVVDMPYGTYEGSPDTALRNARRVLAETGADAVKVEGGTALAATIALLVDAGVPVMGHIGLMPQSFDEGETYRVQGKTEEQVEALIADAEAVQRAGAFSLVIEGTIESVAVQITRAIDIPTIGIGASSACDGQILVSEDMLGITGDRVPRFVKRYADLSGEIERAVAHYARDVRARRFPDDAHVYESGKRADPSTSR